MYEAKYKQETVKRREPDKRVEDKETTILQANFDFRIEVPKYMRKAVAARMFTEEAVIGDPLKKYLCEYEKLLYDDRGKEFSEYFYDNQRKVFVSSPLFLPPLVSKRLMLNIKVVANGARPLEQMLDLDAINHLILTGELPKKQ